MAENSTDLLPVVKHMGRSAESKTVYIIDPDASERHRLESALSATFRRIETFDSARSFLAQRASIHQGCLITVSVLSETGVLEFIDRLKSEGIRLPVIVLGQGGNDMSLAVKIMRAGAADFIERPFTDQRVRKAARNAMA